MTGQKERFPLVVVLEIVVEGLRGILGGLVSPKRVGILPGEPGYVTGICLPIVRGIDVAIFAENTLPAEVRMP